MRIRNIVAALAAVLVASAVVAQERRLTLDPRATTIEFTLGATLHDVHGLATLDRGEVRFGTIPGPAVGEVVVDASSAETGNEKRDRKMHKEVLESASHPRIVLAVERLEGVLPETGSGRVVIRGSMELHGGAHPVELPAEVVVEGDRVRIRSRFEVPYVEWGLEDPSAFVLRVAKHVTVEVEAEGNLTVVGE